LIISGGRSLVQGNEGTLVFLTRLLSVIPVFRYVDFSSVLSHFSPVAARMVPRRNCMRTELRIHFPEPGCAGSCRALTTD